MLIKLQLCYNMKWIILVISLKVIIDEMIKTIFYLTEAASLLINDQVFGFYLFKCHVITIMFADPQDKYIWDWSLYLDSFLLSFCFPVFTPNQMSNFRGGKLVQISVLNAKRIILKNSDVSFILHFCLGKHSLSHDSF